MPRPAMWSKARAQKVIEARRLGASYKAAAAAAGISDRLLRKWRDDRPEFELALDAADAAHQREVLEALRPSLLGERDPKTGEFIRDEKGRVVGRAPADVLMRWLAAKWPEEFGRNRLEVTGAGGGPVEHTDPEANRRALEARLERLAARRADLAANGSGPAPREPETANGGPGRP